MQLIAPLRSLALTSLLLLVAACARGNIGDGQMEGPDGGAQVNPEFDAQPPQEDAAPAISLQTVTLQGTASNVIVPDNSIACHRRVDNVFLNHAENHYYRTYSLPDLGITSDLAVSSVDIGIQEATSVAGTQPIRLSLYVLDGDFLTANLTPLGERNLDVADQALQVLTVPIEARVPAGSTLVVEVFTPDGEIDNNIFVIGSNTEVESSRSYIVAPSNGCDVVEPTAISQLGIPGLLMSLVLNVTGEHAP